MREGLKVEFKRGFGKDVLRTVVAFANTQGGKIYIGYDDDGSVLGVENPDYEILTVTNSIRDSIKPDVTMFIACDVHIDQGKEVIVVDVQRGVSCPYYLAEKGLRPSGVFVRQGASSVPASEVAIREMILETDGNEFESVRALDQDLSFDSMKKAFEEAELRIGNSQMRSLNLIDSDGLFTNVGLLLSDQCPYTIKAAIFEGTNKGRFKDRVEFSGSVLKHLVDTYAFLDRYNRTRSEIQGLKRVDQRDYPEIAIREALLNAIVHKDYALSSSILISLFDDRMEIVTIGGVIKGIGEDDILLGVSVLRNRYLADVFYKLKWVEACGTGIQKIMESYEKHKIKPKIEVSSNAFKITLPNTQYLDALASYEVSLNKSETKVMEMFNRSYTIKRADIEEELSVSQPMAVKILKSLQEKDQIIRMGNGKNTEYRQK